MNNEEKILAILETLNQKVDNNEERMTSMLETMQGDMKIMQSDIKDVKGRQANTENKLTNVEIGFWAVNSDTKDIKGRLTNIETDLTGVKREIVITNLIIENQIQPAIQAIHEGQIGLREKLTDVKTTVDEIAETAFALDIVHIKK